MVNFIGIVASTFQILLLAWQAHGAVDCTTLGSGRHAEPTDTTCQNYTLCVFSSTTRTYVSYNYTCPTTSVFNPNTAMCTASANYNCTTTTTNTTTTTCTEDGFIADPSSTNCNSYIQCTQINGSFIETPFTCPDETLYNPNTTNCESDYNCTSTTTFTCTAAGRFANAADTTCQSYYLCVFLSTNSTYVAYQYSCPSTSVFSPTARLCTTSYTCT